MLYLKYKENIEGNEISEATCCEEQLQDVFYLAIEL